VLPCAMHVAGAMQVVRHLKNPISGDILRVIGMDVAHLHWLKMTSLGKYAALHIPGHSVRVGILIYLATSSQTWLL
jgi:hypothetical protein